MMFNQDDSISEYLFDDYQGEVDFVLDKTYEIPPNEINLFTLESGIKKDEIYAVYIGDINTINKDTVILYCHGNRDHMDFYWQRAKLLANTGGNGRFGVLMIDYKGYGLSEGTPSEEGLKEDVKVAMEWLYERGLRSNRLVIYGFSLGTFPAIHFAGDTSLSMIPNKLIVEAPFASTDVMAADGVLLDMPASYLSNARFDNVQGIEKVDIPLLWMHGVQDRFLPIKTHGEVVFDHYNGTYKQAKRVQAAAHSSVPQTLGFEEYNQLMLTFILRK